MLQNHESEDISECDVYDTDEIQKSFNLKCQLKTETLTTNKYILHLSASIENAPNIILGLSDNTVEVHKLSDRCLAKLVSFELTSDVTGVQVSPDNNNLFYVGSGDCQIKLCDIRTAEKVVSVFKDNTVEDDKKVKPSTCFDVSPNNFLLAAGTDLYEGDAFILFWDVRNAKLLGGYWESHTDDVTQVKFHPDDANKLMSGSTDGLVNIYNLLETSEDDALMDTLNTESSVEQLRWCPGGGVDIVSCITHTSDLQLWKLDDAEPYVHFQRGDIARIIKTGNQTYLASTEINRNNNVFYLAGSNFRDGEVLRCFGVVKKMPVPAYTFHENKQRVRSSWFNKYTEVLITGGEKGILSIWDINSSFENN